MGHLIKREWFLLIRSRSFWVGCVISILSVILICSGHHYLYTRVWQEHGQEQTDNGMEELQEQLEDTSIDEDSKDSAERSLKIIEYCEKHHIEDSDWQTEIVRYYLFQSAPDQEMQKAVNAAMEQNDWKIYYRYLDSVNQKDLKSGNCGGMDRILAQTQLKTNALLYQYNITPEAPTEQYRDWRNRLVYQYQEIQERLIGSVVYPGDEDYYLTSSEKSELENQIKILHYRLKYEIRANKKNAAADSLQVAEYAKYVTYLVLVFLFVQMFVQEFDRKMIQQTVLLPHSRRKIYFTKLFVMLQVSVAFLLLDYLVSVIVVGILSPEKLYDQVVLLIGHPIRLNFYLYLLIHYLLGVIEIMMAALVVVWLGVCGFSSIFAIIAGAMVCYLKFLLCFLANRYHLFLLRFVPFLWFDWKQFMEGQVYVPNTSAILGIVGTVLLSVILLLHSERLFRHIDL